MRMRRAFRSGVALAPELKS